MGGGGGRSWALTKTFWGTGVLKIDTGREGRPKWSKNVTHIIWMAPKKVMFCYCYCCWGLQLKTGIATEVLIRRINTYYLNAPKVMLLLFVVVVVDVVVVVVVEVFSSRPELRPRCWFDGSFERWPDRWPRCKRELCIPSKQILFLISIISMNTLSKL